MRKMSALTIGALVSALSGAGALAQNEIIAVLTKNQTNPYFQALRVGADQAAKALGAKTVHYIPTKPDSIPEQMSQIEDVIIKKPNAIVFVPVDYKAMVAGMTKMNEAGIPVTNVTNRVAGGKSIAFVGGDDYSLGLQTARFLIKSMGGKGNIVILEGVKGSLTNLDRVRGFNDAIKEAKDVKLLASQPANYQHLQAIQVLENLLQAHPKIDGVLAANDAMAIGAIEALDGANRQALVVGINGTKEAVEAIKAGKLLASGDYNGFLQGCISTAIAVRALRHEAVPTEIVLKATVIENSNYQPYDLALEVRTCPKWEEVPGLSSAAKS